MRAIEFVKETMAPLTKKLAVRCKKGAQVNRYVVSYERVTRQKPEVLLQSSKQTIENHI